MKKYKRNEQGFIALISAIIISAILLELSLSTSAASFTARSNSLHHELKLQSKASAESCSYIALKNSAENYFYNPVNEIINLGFGTCTILFVAYGPENTVFHKKTAVIQTSAEFRNTWSRIEIHVTILNPSFIHSPSSKQIVIDSWREL